MLQACGTAEARYVSRTAITGADIPQELFKYILWHVTEGEIGPIPSSRENDRFLLSIATVSKYFRRACRRRLYREVVLRDAKHLSGLLGLLASDCAVLSSTDIIRIAPGEADNMWVRHVLTHLLPRMRYGGTTDALEIFLEVHGSPQPDLIPCPTQFLRSYPCCFFYHIRTLRLRSVRFRRGDHLLRSLSALRNVTEISLHEVTCDTVAEHTGEPHLSLHHPILKLHVTRCDRSCFFSVVPAALESPRKSLGLASLIPSHLIIPTATLLHDMFYDIQTKWTIIKSANGE